MTRFHSLMCIFMLCCLLCHGARLFAAGSDEQYARYLYTNGYFEEAARTYLFLQYSSDDPGHKNYYSYWMGKSQLEQKNFPVAEKTLQKLIQEKDFFSVSFYDVYFDYLRSLYFQKKFYEVSFETENGKYRDDRKKIAELNGWSAINTSDWEKAGTIFSQLASDPAGYDHERIKTISDIINNRSVGDQKSPALAGILSALLPGAGHVYSGNYTSAFGAFFLNAIFGSLTGYSVYKKQWGYAAFFGLLEAGWYTGNVVSAYQDAKLRNAKDDNDCRLSLSAQFPFRIGN